MQEMVVTSKIISIQDASHSIRTTIPQAVKDTLGLKPGDYIEWHIGGTEGAYFYKVFKHKKHAHPKEGN